MSERIVIRPSAGAIFVGPLVLLLPTAFCLWLARRGQPAALVPAVASGFIIFYLASLRLVWDGQALRCFRFFWQVWSVKAGEASLTMEETGGWPTLVIRSGTKTHRISTGAVNLSDLRRLSQVVPVEQST